MDHDLSPQYEEFYDDGVITNELRRKVGDTGDICYECDHCGAFRIDKIERFKCARRR